ncbi:hypothetical protein O9H85_30265 [Paenibacillus filicis]|uniref:ChrB N-terminal domain-containing protein n=1 Tax=Paenibacillus gyeongsangnamensis TaxID=3388067 RepID=A0ABT4QI94_9BACL|nr:Chromate resistance protein ChrB [Paenibacillus filicis]MCZ8516596.1 hypothetical protein [Paenibacillus filicis]
MNHDSSWLLFSYRVPSDPSTLRVRIWRTLKSMGVLYIQQSVCLAPLTPEVKKKLQQIQQVIEESDGESLLLEVSQFSETSTEELVEMFNKQRSVEYNEFLGGCSLFLREIETESEKGNFTFNEVEENEADLVKLKRWHRKILKRDFFNCALHSQALDQLGLCESVLNEFTHKVYLLEGKAEGEIIQ